MVRELCLLFHEHHINCHVPIHVYFVWFDNLEVSAAIKFRLAQNYSYVLWHQHFILTTCLHELLFFDKNTRKTWVSYMDALSYKLLKNVLNRL